MIILAEHLARPDGPLGVLVLLYVGPDQILPLTSVLVAIVGVLLTFWRYLVGLCSRVWHFLTMRKR